MIIVYDIVKMSILTENKSVFINNLSHDKYVCHVSLNKYTIYESVLLLYRSIEIEEDDVTLAWNGNYTNKNMVSLFKFIYDKRNLFDVCGDDTTMIVAYITKMTNCHMWLLLKTDDNVGYIYLLYESKLTCDDVLESETNIMLTLVNDKITYSNCEEITDDSILICV